MLVLIMATHINTVLRTLAETHCAKGSCLQGVPPKLAPKVSFLREIGEASSFIFPYQTRTVDNNIGAPALPLG